jgi:hypothetical protein
LWAVQLGAGAPPPPPPPPGVEVCVVREGWDAPVTPEAVRDALAWRLPDRAVAVCDTAPAAGCRVHLAAGTGGARTLRVACGAADDPASELRDEVPDAPHDEMVRWVAVEAAALLGAASRAAPPPPPPPPAPPPPSPPPGTPSAPPAPPAEDAEVPRFAPPDSLPARAGLPRLRGALELGAGTAVAPELPGATYAFVVGARVFVWRDVHLLAGGKIAGPFAERFENERDTVADRAFWLGAGYRAAFGSAFVDVALAGQYVVPVLDARGAPAPPREESRTSRLALRGAVELGYRLSAALAATVLLAGSMSFVQRDHISGTRDTLELGTAILDVAAGLEVGF